MGSIRGTFFRQAMFAEFEIKFREMAEAGERVAKSVATCSPLHGPTVTMDGAYASEWEFISHFYRNFYVCQHVRAIGAGVAFRLSHRGRRRT